MVTEISAEVPVLNSFGDRSDEAGPKEAIWRIAFTCSIPASSLITLHLVHLLHLCTWLYKQYTDRQTAPDYRKSSCENAE
ncbi:hypothetical protein CRENBAI_011853 [Crenichthys baileyi]|uniref:Uncharacterized protein n=1 Tax=Crenichthys baileyi TaxID=28760 RepID=A0AAV9RM20_9TELE